MAERGERAGRGNVPARDVSTLDDIGLSRADVAAVLGQPLSVDPLWELERRACLRGNPSLPDATARWLHDSAFTHPRLDEPR
ncbi:hypothetical protein BH23CHL8_BH23CHL8_31030 [soil metagenome]